MEVDLSQPTHRLTQRNNVTQLQQGGGTMVGLKDNGEKKNKEGVEKKKEKNDEAVTSETESGK